jgi:hypothetical protein
MAGEDEDEGFYFRPRCLVRFLTSCVPRESTEHSLVPALVYTVSLLFFFFFFSFNLSD